MVIMGQAGFLKHGTLSWLIDVLREYELISHDVSGIYEFDFLR